jgi:hypothetical protein
MPGLAVKGALTGFGTMAFFPKPYDAPTIIKRVKALLD